MGAPAGLFLYRRYTLPVLPLWVSTVVATATSGCESQFACEGRVRGECVKQISIYMLTIVLRCLYVVHLVAYLFTCTPSKPVRPLVLRAREGIRTLIDSVTVYSLGNCPGTQAGGR